MHIIKYTFTLCHEIHSYTLYYKCIYTHVRASYVSHTHTQTDTHTHSHTDYTPSMWLLRMSSGNCIPPYEREREFYIYSASYVQRMEFIVNVRECKCICKIKCNCGFHIVRWHARASYVCISCVHLMYASYVSKIIGLFCKRAL